MIVRWTKAEDDFLHKCCEKHLSYKEMSESISIISENKRTQFACNKRCYYLGIKNNRDMTFKKGERRIDNINPLPIGTIRVVAGNGGRTAYIKISDEVCNTRTKGHSVGNNKNWIPYAKYIWESKYGSIPEHYSIVHLNGDNLDNSIENLTIVPFKVLADMARNKLFFKNKESTKAGILIAKIEEEIYSIKRDKEKKL